MKLQVADALVRLNGGRGCLTEFEVYSPHSAGRNDGLAIVGPVYTVKVCFICFDRPRLIGIDGRRKRHCRPPTQLTFRESRI